MCNIQLFTSYNTQFATTGPVYDPAMTTSDLIAQADGRQTVIEQAQAAKMFSRELVAEHGRCGESVESHAPEHSNPRGIDSCNFLPQ